MNIFIQLIGFLAWIIITLSYWQKKKKILVIMQIIAQTLYAIHFYMLDGMSGALSNIVGIIGLLLIYIKKENMKCYYLIPIILIMYIITAIYTYDGLFSLLPVIACLIQLLSIYISSMKITKIGGIISAVCWLIYGICVLSYASIITEVILIISTFISLKRKKV